MTVFEAAREVTALDVAQLYGLEFGRNGRAKCPWHDDHRPDLKFLSSGRCYCHACHEGGDSVALVAQIFSLSPKAAAQKLVDDFHLTQPTDNRPNPTAIVKAQQRRDKRKQERERWSRLCDVVHLADAELRRFDPETAWDNPRFRTVLRARCKASEQLDVAWETLKNEHSG